MNSPVLVAAVVTGIIALFSGAAAAALITGLFTRRKIHAEAVAAVTAASTAQTVGEATAAQAIQAAAHGMVASLTAELDRSEARRVACEGWRSLAVAAAADHAPWDAEALELLTIHARNQAAADMPPPPPPLLPTTTPTT